MFRAIFNLAFLFLTCCLIAASLAYMPATPWWFELFTHFFSLYALGSIVLIVYYFLQKNRVLFLVSLSYFIFVSIILAPYLIKNNANVATAADQKITVLFSNTHFANVSVEKLAGLIADKKPDLVVLAELKEKEYNQVLEKLPDYAGVHVTEGPDPWAHAISYLAVRSLGPVRSGVTRFDDVSAALVISIDAVPDLQLIGMHIFPPRSKRTIDLRDLALQNLGEYLKVEPNAVVVGDLNISNFSPPFTKLLQEGSLTDARIGSGVFGTWPTSLPTFATIPIDHALWKGAWRVCKLDRGPRIGSDHFPLVIKLCYNTTEEK